MLFFNKTTRGASAAVILTLALAGNALAAFQSGGDVGAYCARTQSPGDSSGFNGCCNGGCASIHGTSGDQAGFDSCMNKCMSYYVAPVQAPPADPSV